MERKLFVQAAIELFNKRSVNFTLDELAKKLRMSKRTIYEQYGNKEKVIELVARDVMDSVRQAEIQVYQSDKKTSEKFMEVLVMFPAYGQINYDYLEDLAHVYPRIYDIIMEGFDFGWDEKFKLYDQGVKEGVFKDLPRQSLKLIMLGIFREAMSYGNDEKLIRSCVEIVFKGVEK